MRHGLVGILVMLGVLLLAVGCSTAASIDTAETTTPTSTTVPETTSTTVPPTTLAETTTTTVAEAKPVVSEELLALLDTYETAYNTGDETAFRSLFAADFSSANPNDTGTRQTVEERIAWMTNSQIQESTLSIERCIPTSYGAQCQFVHSGVVEDAIYFGSLINTVQVYAEDDKITQMLITYQPTYELQVKHGQQVLDWVAENYPDDRPNMSIIAIGIVNDQHGQDPVEVVELWTKYAPLWADAGRP